MFEASGISFALDANSQLFDQSSSPPQSISAPVNDLQPSLSSVMVHLLLTLLFVIGLIILTVWLLKFLWGKRSFGALQDNQPIKVLANVYLGPRRTIFLIEVANKVLIVGSGNSEISCLCIIDDPEEISTIKNSMGNKFQNIFEKTVEKQGLNESHDVALKIIEESKNAFETRTNKSQQKNRYKKMEDLNERGEVE